METAPVKAAFTDVMPTASADINVESIIFDNDQLDGNLTYIVRAGDTIQSIAKELGTTVDNIKKVNGLKSDSLSAGKKLTISQLPGIIVALKADTSLGDFAEEYNLSLEDLKSLNYISDTKKIVHAGDELFIPITEADAQDKGLMEKPEVPVAAKPAPVPSSTNKPVTKPTTVAVAPKKKTAVVVAQVVTKETANDIDYKKGTILATRYQKGTGAFGFAAGYCTDYAAAKRPDLFNGANGLERFRGNAKDWDNNALKVGNTVSKTPKKGAIAVFEPGRGGASGYGHVAYVEEVDTENNTIVISDMNGPGGRNVVTRRVVSADLASYIY